MITQRNYLKLLLLPALLAVASCKKDKQITIPTLTTTAVSNVTPTSASSGGSITSNGGSEIIVSGICWSSVHNLPTITDDTTKTDATSGSFTANMINLDPSATYYVRAYATNSAGTGYGDVVTFSAGNAPPEALSLLISGTAAVGSTLTADYTYFDFEDDPESGTSIQWYIADDTIGSTVHEIDGAVYETYVPVDDDNLRFIRVGIVPKASAGGSPGVATYSQWIGPIGAEAVTFTYNGQTVTYGTILSPVSGKKWLDRNLGAPNVASGFFDWANMGDLFQWGRGADGHQLVIRAETTEGTSAVNGPADTTLSSLDTPGHNKFIAPTGIPYDWRSPQNNNFWQGTAGVNNPCPTGWRLPTQADWEAENLTQESAVVYGQLKVTASGYRLFTTGEFGATTFLGAYWTSTGVVDANGNMRTVAVNIGDFNAPLQFINYRRAYGCAVRCIKDL